MSARVNHPVSFSRWMRTRCTRLPAAARLCVLTLGLSVLTVAGSAPPPPPPANFSGTALHTYEAWRAALDHAGDANLRRKLKLINDFFNQHIQYASDESLWQHNDYWSAPLQTMRRGAGDCEDYVIAKYASLRELGVPADKLRLIYVRARLEAPGNGSSRAHMVLGYYPSPGAIPLILDSLLPGIVPATERPDLTPIFSFNAHGLWDGDGPPSGADPVARLSPWRSVLERMQAAGFRFDQ